MIRHTGANMETVRKKNRAAILKYINDHGPISRKDLANVIGLTPAAVTQICTDLMGEGVLVETGTNAKSQGAGRKKILLDINYDVAYVFAITIEPRDTVIALSNLQGKQIAIKKCETKKELEPEVFLGQVAEICCSMQKALPEGKKISMAAVGISGLVDKELGISNKAYGIWEEPVQVRDILSPLLDMPVLVENNVQALAIAEQLYGTGREHDNLMVIKWGPGVGCAMIIDQQVYEGRHNKAAELGHFIVDPKGSRCSCGRRGCLETKISYQALQQIMPFKEEEFGKAYKAAKKEGKEQAFDQAMDVFARSIVNSATIMAPNRIVLTGDLFASESIRQEVIAACERYDPTWSEGRVVYSKLWEKESYVGPVAVCAKEMYFS